MLETFAPLPVKAICAFIYSKEEVYSQTKQILERKYGPVDFESKRIDFTYTDYYTPEMGKPLYRRFISFKKLRKADRSRGKSNENLSRFVSEFFASTI